MAAGVAGALALGALYKALALGPMSVVAPISASGAALPVVVGFATGAVPGTVGVLGLVVTFAGVVLAAREPARDGERSGPRGPLLALVAALGFGLYYLCSEDAAEESVAYLLLLGRLAALPLIAVAVAVQRAVAPVPPRLVVAILAVGALDLAATGLYGLAATEGLLAVVAVIASLYPVATVLLARAVLGERLAVSQQAGVALAFSGVALLALS
jgi:drug/metabolite transporter (DMT)-like permease